MTNQTASIEAVNLTRSLFESIHGNLGVLRFNIEELTPLEGDISKESRKWKIVCSFFETLQDTSPSKYEVMADLDTKQLTVKKLTNLSKSPSKIEGDWTMSAKKKKTE